MQHLIKPTISILLLGLCSCSALSRVTNPFTPPETEAARSGDMNDHALNEDQNKEDSARSAIEAMASYRRTQDPQPVNPVIQPAVVRLMWIPDHLNSHGDLVPAHYYYLKVLKDRWAVSDAFELESQLGSDRDASNVPYVYQNEAKKHRD